MGLEQFILQYGGWVGLIVYFLYAKVWPVIASKLIPAWLKRSEQQLTAREEELLDDKKFRQKIELNRMETETKIADAVHVLAVGISSTNEKIAMVVANQAMTLHRQDVHLGILNEINGEMRLLKGALTGFSDRKTDSAPTVPIVKDPTKKE